MKYWQLKDTEISLVESYFLAITWGSDGPRGPKNKIHKTESR